jgi:hypothetical protein
MFKPFLKASDLRPTGDQFACGASRMGLRRGHFPGAIETDLGNGCPLHLDRSISDSHGIFVGVAYRQSGGCEVLVFLE